MNEATFDEFMNFNLDHLHDVGAKLSMMLLDQFGIRFHIETVHGYVRFESRYVFILPRKDIYIFSYERYKVLLLSRR